MDTDHRPLEYLAHGLRFVHRPCSAGRIFVDVERVVDGRHIDQVGFASDDVLTAELLEEVAAQWVARRLGAVPPPPVCCSGCGAELVPALNHDTDVQFDGALTVTFGGGYGMFVDPIGNSEPLTALLCEVCAEALCATAPWARALLRPDAQS